MNQLLLSSAYSFIIIIFEFVQLISSFRLVCYLQIFRTYFLFIQYLLVFNYFLIAFLSLITLMTTKFLHSLILIIIIISIMISFTHIFQIIDLMTDYSPNLNLVRLESVLQTGFFHLIRLINGYLNHSLRSFIADY